MYGRATRAQIRALMGGRMFMLVFAVLLALMLSNFTENVLAFRGYDVISMYHPMKLLTLSFNKTNYRADSAGLLVQVVPLLVCLPAALNLDRERRTGQATVMISRLGSRVYLWSKVTAVFVVTTVAFSLPFLLEIPLNCVSFPLKATGDFYNQNAYERLAREALYQLSWLYRLSPYLYAAVGALSFGAFAGLLAAATTTLSALVQVKFRVMLLLPAFLLLQLTLYLGENGSESWYLPVMFFNDSLPGTPCFPILVCGLLLFTAAGTCIAARRDWLA